MTKPRNTRSLPVTLYAAGVHHFGSEAIEALQAKCETYPAKHFVEIEFSGGFLAFMVKDKELVHTDSQGNVVERVTV